MRRLATGAPLLKQGRPLPAMRETVAMIGSATVRAWGSRQGRQRKDRAVAACYGCLQPRSHVLNATETDLRQADKLMLMHACIRCILAQGRTHAGGVRDAPAAP